MRDFALLCITVIFIAAGLPVVNRVSRFFNELRKNNRW